MSHVLIKKVITNGKFPSLNILKIIIMLKFFLYKFEIKMSYWLCDQRVIIIASGSDVNVEAVLVV